MLLEGMTTVELLEARALLQQIEKAVLSGHNEQRRQRVGALKRRLSERFEGALGKVFSTWRTMIAERLGKLDLGAESLYTEVLANYELAIVDLPTYNALARRFYNEGPKTVTSLQEEYTRRIDGLVSLSLREKKRLLRRIAGMRPVERRHPGAVAPAVAVSVDPNPLEQIMFEEMEVGAVEGGRLTFRERGEKPSLFALRDPKALEWISNQSYLFAEHTASRYTQQLHWRAVKTGLDEGLSIPHIERALREEFGNLTRRDSIRIARTATAQAVEHGRWEAYNELGFKLGEVVNGPNPCDECAELAARGVLPLEELRGLVPVHPNCECDIVAVD